MWKFVRSAIRFTPESNISWILLAVWIGLSACERKLTKNTKPRRRERNPSEKEKPRPRKHRQRRWQLNALIDLITSIESLQRSIADIEAKLQLPEVISQPKKLQSLSIEYTRLKEKLALAEDVKQTRHSMMENEKLLTSETDPDLLAMAQEEKIRLEKHQKEQEGNLQRALLPEDPLDQKDIIIEIRAGAGGDEAALFAAELYRMYTRYAESRKWRVSIMNVNRTGIGGFKEIIFEINGSRVYNNLKYESGVHRVQRIPETEKSGRVHTSTVTVVVLPEAEAVDIEVKPEQIRIDVFRSSGHGGQSVNTTDSAVRITYLPTGMMVTCQDEKSQIKNREKALKVLRARLLAAREEEESKKRGDARRAQIGHGDRSEKIRTYNFPQDRVTDHRIKQSWSNLPFILEGNLDDMIAALLAADQQEQIEHISS